VTLDGKLFHKLTILPIHPLFDKDSTHAEMERFQRPATVGQLQAVI